MNTFLDPRPIIELPKGLADKIAAGEVIERPVSVIKELLENSIDAGSDSIVIEIKNGGKTYMRITDNGSGIIKNHVKTAFQRHATSKITCENDLFAIDTLGFRGEALASIAAVSYVEMITKTRDEKAGISLKIVGGSISSFSDTGCAEGTTIIVSQLFFNVPARLKFMKNDGTEANQIIDLVSKIALAFPHIKMRLISDGNILFTTHGSGDAYKNILSIFGKDLGTDLISINTDSLLGYISPIGQTRSNKKFQIYFVNGRYIQSKIIDTAIATAYKERAFEGRYSIAFLFLNVDPAGLDVNIHPNKKEIKFLDEKKIQDLITASLIDALTDEKAIPKVMNSNLFKDKRLIETEPISPVQMEAKPISKQIQAVQATKNVPEAGKIPEVQNSLQILETSQAQATSQVKENVIPYVAEKKEAPLSEVDIKQRRLTNKLVSLNIVGNIFSTYILATDEENFYMIDQHAAHERVFYEELLLAYEKEAPDMQQLMQPQVKDLPLTVKNAKNTLELIQKFGFEVEEFGSHTCIIKAIPAFMNFTQAEEFFTDILDNINETMDLKSRARVEKIISQSCKKAVKANDHLSWIEIKQLLMDLSQTINPLTCPHGRPTLIQLNKLDIEKLFKRA